MNDLTWTPAAMSDGLRSLGGFLRCERCGTTEPLGNIGVSLATGWPKCCGYTMTWWTQRQINAGEVTPIASR